MKKRGVINKVSITGISGKIVPNMAFLMAAIDTNMVYNHVHDGIL